MSSRNPKKALGIFSLAIMTAISVDSIRNLPTNAIFGSSIIFFFILATFIFLIPTTLVASELAVNNCHSSRNGIYDWVKSAFGPRVGLFAIWLQWIQNVIWYPTILSFAGGTIGYLINPDLVNNKFFIISIILIIFTSVTIINLYGIRSSAWFSNLCGIIGLIGPMSFIIGLGGVWLYQGNTVQIHFTSQEIFPDLKHMQSWIALTSVMLSFAGMEITTVHAPDTKNPNYSFPRGLLLAVIIILFTLLTGALSIAIIIPKENISLVAGIMQAYEKFLSFYHIRYLLPLPAISLVIGVVGSISNWSFASCRGLALAAEDGYLPRFFSQKNKANAPQKILIFQGLLVLLLSMTFILLPTINSSYWILTVICANIYMLMYMIMFITFLRLRYQRKQKNGFEVPGGKKMLWIIAGCGLLSTLLTFSVGFVPPQHIKHLETVSYESFLILGMLILSIPPLFFYYWSKIIHKINQYQKVFSSNIKKLYISSRASLQRKF